MSGASSIGARLASGARRAIARWRPLRIAVKSAPAQHLIQTARGARVVRPGGRFALRQLGPPRLAGYRLRDSDVAVFIRHRSRDVNILNEIFGGPRSRHCYEPPAPVAARLDRLPAPRVLDLGANVGLFGAFVLRRWPAATVRSFEPDPRNLVVLDRTVGANGGPARWTVERAAVASEAGTMDFAAGLFADSHLLAEDEDRGDGGAIRVPAIDFLARPPRADLLKVDIEGGEWAILTDPRLGAIEVGVVVLEWHVGGCPFPAPRAACRRLLGEAGFDRFEEVSPGTESGLLWAWRDRP